MNRALQLLRPPWPLLARIYFSFPPARWLEDRLYAWIADHRSLVGRIWNDPPACGEHAGADREN